jgi:acyl dehydratase
LPDPDFGRITDERVRRLRDRIGVDLDPANFEPPRDDPAAWRPTSTGFNHEVTADGVRHFVNGYGDDAPLYCDPGYAAGTPWRGLIAPPMFVWTMYLPPRDDDITYGGGDEPPRRPKPEIRERLRGDPLRGTGALQSRLEYEFYRPLRLGDRLYAKRSLVAVNEKQSSWGGRAVHVTWGLVTWNQRRELVHFQRGTWVKTERRQLEDGRAGGRKPVQPPADPYTQEQLAEIDATYAAEERRGGEVRYWEDVEVGEELPVRVKGPLRLTDVILWHAGFGQAFPTYAFRLAYEKRRQTPGLYTPNEYNVPDIVQRMHWDAEWARRVGAAERYDYGALRETWLCQLITDWAGDASWITSLEVEHRRFNYIGDTTWLKGKVVGKTYDDGQPRVRLSVWCENQRGEVTSPATATIALGTREGGDLAMPRPAADDPIDLLRLEIDRLTGAGA